MINNIKNNYKQSKKKLKDNKHLKETKPYDGIRNE